jgi:hypothetical protein
MAFKVYPNQVNAPMRVPREMKSGFIPFSELRSSATNGKMFIRVVKLGGGCQPPGGKVPKFLLRARTTTGAAPDEKGKLIPEVPTTASIVNRAALGSPPIARASYGVLPRDTYLITVEMIGSEVSDWAIKIGNEDLEDRRFVWVVADSEDQTMQAWINVGHRLEIRASAEENSTGFGSEDIQITNLGTGDLKLADPPTASGLPGDRFKLGPIPDPIAPNSCAKLKITYEGRASDPEEQGTLRFDSNDSRADGSPEHNAEVALTGKTSVIPPDDGGGGEPFPEPQPCLVADCGCPALQGPLDDAGRCRNLSCRHPASRHKQLF